VCNASAGQILGEPAESLVGRDARDWFPDARGSGLIARSLERGVRFKGAESSLEREGSRVPVGVSCAPIASADGGVEGAVATFQDLSEIRQLQRQLLQNEKMASIGQLAAGVAHEINNPMGFIHANLAQMAEYAADLRQAWQHVEEVQKAADRGDAEELRRAAARLADASTELDVAFLLVDLAKAIRESQEGSERIRHIVADLRDFSYRDTGERVMADLTQCLDSTANIVWPMMKHIVVLERHYDDLPAVRCYPMQLKQVFMNLLVNAYQAIEERVGSSGEMGRIELRTRRRGERVEVSVSDTGTGIAPAHVDRIFDPFFTTKRVGSGTGLGLSMSYSIVQRHGGTMEVESVAGEGTTFRVLLPLDDEGVG
jgi:two-component system NtrC family sensor kinase